MARRAGARRADRHDRPLLERRVAAVWKRQAPCAICVVVDIGKRINVGWAALPTNRRVVLFDFAPESLSFVLSRNATALFPVGPVDSSR